MSLRCFGYAIPTTLHAHAALLLYAYRFIFIHDSDTVAEQHANVSRKYDITAWLCYLIPL